MPESNTLSAECRYPPDPMTVAQARVMLQLHQLCDQSVCLHRRDAYRVTITSMRTPRDHRPAVPAASTYYSDPTSSE